MFNCRLCKADKSGVQLISIIPLIHGEFDLDRSHAHTSCHIGVGILHVYMCHVPSPTPMVHAHTLEGPGGVYNETTPWTLGQGVLPLMQSDRDHARSYVVSEPEPRTLTTNMDKIAGQSNSGLWTIEKRQTKVNSKKS